MNDKKKRRRSVSVGERSYVLLMKLAAALDASGSHTVETAIAALADVHGVEVSELDVLELRTRPKRPKAPRTASQTVEPEPASGIFTF